MKCAARSLVHNSKLPKAVCGAEGSNFCVQGLWQRPLDALVDFVKSENFNALRLSISVDVALDLDGIKATSNGLAANPQLQVPRPALVLAGFWYPHCTTGTAFSDACG